MSYTASTSNTINRNALRVVYNANSGFDSGTYPFEDVNSNLDTAEKRREYFLSRFVGDRVFEDQGRYNADGSSLTQPTHKASNGGPKVFITVVEDPSTPVDYMSGYTDGTTFVSYDALHGSNAAGSMAYFYSVDYWTAIADCIVGLGCNKFKTSVWQDSTNGFVDKYKLAIGRSSRFTYDSEQVLTTFTDGSTDVEVVYGVA
jgi:hypothetical protein